MEEKLLSLKSELVMMSEALRTVRGEKTAVEEVCVVCLCVCVCVSVCECVCVLLHPFSLLSGPQELELVRTVEVKFTAQVNV